MPVLPIREEEEEEEEKSQLSMHATCVMPALETKMNWAITLLQNIIKGFFSLEPKIIQNYFGFFFYYY